MKTVEHDPRVWGTVFIGPREKRLIELDKAAWAEGSAEGRIGGIGAVQIVRVDRRRQYRADMTTCSGAALYRNARDLDRNEQLGATERDANTCTRCGLAINREHTSQEVCECA